MTMVNEARVKVDEKVDMKNLYQDVLESYKPCLQGIDVQVDYGDEMEVQGGVEQYSSVFDNFVSNSVKAMEGRSDSKLSIKFWKENVAGVDYLCFEQTDNGRGIPEKDIKDIGYKPFKTDDPTQIGRGLGWVAAKLTLGLYGGEAHIESKEGEWTKVTGKIPYEQKNGNVQQRD